MKTLFKKQTHIGKIREKNLHQIERVCELLDWTHDDYTNHQYHEYEMFIHQACKDLPHAARYIRYSPQFRGLYNNEWLTRNERDFLPFAENAVSDEYDFINEYEEIKNHSDGVTTKKWGIIITGISCIQGVDYGNPSLLEEYLHIHSYQSLFCDDDFASKYRHFLNQILPYV